MPSAKHRYPEDAFGGRRADLRPYFFRRDPSDVLEEAFEELLRTRFNARQTVTAPDVPHGDRSETDDERDVLREQRWTLFKFDESMQRLFDGDFEAFCAAMDDPDCMQQRLEERMNRLRGSEGMSHAESSSARLSGWDDHGSPARQWEEQAQHAHGDDGDASQHEPRISLADDLVYEAAFRWACRVERWSSEQYQTSKKQDRDCYRIHVNALLVPSKIAFGFSGGIDDDVTGLEVSAVGYRQAAIFLSRVLESLASCYGRHVGDPEDVHGFIDEGRELLADVESKLAEIESEIRFRGGRS